MRVDGSPREGSTIKEVISTPFLTGKKKKRQQKDHTERGGLREGGGREGEKDVGAQEQRKNSS